jgi:hypothetical protein
MADPFPCANKRLCFAHRLQLLCFALARQICNPARDKPETPMNIGEQHSKHRDFIVGKAVARPAQDPWLRSGEAYKESLKDGRHVIIGNKVRPSIKFLLTRFLD